MVPTLRRSVMPFRAFSGSKEEPLRHLRTARLGSGLLGPSRMIPKELEVVHASVEAQVSRGCAWMEREHHCDGHQKRLDTLAHSERLSSDVSSLDARRDC